MKITIIGTGAFGLALGNVLNKNKNLEVVLWTAFANEYNELKTNNTHQKVLPGIKLDKLNVTMDLENALEKAEIIIIAIPCNHVKEVLIKLKSYLTDTSKVILVSKGLEKKTDSLMSEIYYNLNLKGTVSYLAGPTFAKELIRNDKAGITLATTDKDTKMKMTLAFKDTNVELELIEDIIGLQLYSVIKNILAILIGSINSKYKSDTTKAYYLTKMYRYATNLVVSLGGKEEISSCYGALGDILLTCNSTNSRNYSYGTLLYEDIKKAKTYRENTTVEGALAVDSLVNILKRKNKDSLVMEKIRDYFLGIINLDELLKIF